MREALDRAGNDYAEYLPAPIRAEETLVGDRPGARGGPLPGDVRGSRRRAPPAGLRRAARAPARDGRAAPAARPRRGPARSRSTTPPTPRCATSLTGSIGRKLERRRRADRRPGRRRSTPSGTTWPGRPRCSASSRATSAAARPRSRRRPWRRRPGPASRAPSSRRPTCSPGSTTRRWPALLEDAGVPVELLTGSLTAAAAAPHARARRSPAMAPVVVGTHALIQERVEFAALGVVVIDEQHRFGVEQRGQLEAKAGGQRPARPADDRDARSRGRSARSCTPTSTCPTCGRRRRAGSRSGPGSATPDHLGPTWDRVRAEAAAGPSDVRRRAAHRRGGPGGRRRGASPTIFDSSAPAAEAEAVRLRELLAPLRVGMVHGRMKAADRDAEMARFRDGELDVLVGTTVVEVGVDVPEATMMIDRGRRPVRAGPAPPAPRPRRARDGRELLRPRLGHDRRDRPGPAQGRRRDPRRVRARRERDFELRREGDVLGLAQSGPAAAAGRVAPGPRARRARAAGPRARRGAPRRGRPPAAPTAAPLPAASWSRAGSSGSGPASRRAARDRTARAVADAGRVIAGSAKGIRLRAPGPGHPADRRPGEADAVRDPRAGAAGRPRPRPVRRQRRRRDRGAVARRRAARRSSRRTRAPRR